VRGAGLRVRRGAARVAALAMAIGVAAAIAVTGCGAPPPARLLEVRGLGPGRVERGELLRVEGAGFPPGREGRLALAGVVRRPAEAPRAVSFTRSLHAVSAERAELRVDDALLDELGGGGTFRGRIEVSFDAAVAGAAAVTGARDGVVVLFVPPTSLRFAGELARDRATVALFAFLGVTPETQLDADGVRIVAVAADGRAEAAGLREGDVVRESEGALVTTSADLAPAPGARALHWKVMRGGEAAPIALTLSLRGLGGAPDAEWSWAAALVVLLVLAALLRYGPAAPDFAAVGEALRGMVRVRPARRELGIALGAALSAALLCGPLPVGVDAIAALGALAALRFAGVVAGGRAGLRGRVLRALGRELAGWLALGALLVSAGTSRFAGVIAAQGAAPLGCAALAGPGTLLASWLWLRLVCTPDDAETATRGSEAVRRALAAALLAVCACGGGFGLGAMVWSAVGVALAAGGASMIAERLAALPAMRGGTAVGLGLGVFLGSVWLAARPLPAVFAAMLGAATLAVGGGLVVMAWSALRTRPALPALRLVD
jgi:hypothetical protein